MNRRSALKLMGAALASFILPAPRRTIDMKAFCATYPGDRYDMTLPYCLDDWTYATTGNIAVRVPPATADRFSHSGKVPPFESLSWDMSHRGWMPVAPRRRVLAVDSTCPKCDGYGAVLNGVGIPSCECKDCDGCGCDTCADSGVTIPSGAEKCSVCNGHGHGVFPSLVQVGDRYFDAATYEKVVSLGAECVIVDAEFCVPVSGSKNHSLMKFKFDGGEGMMLSLPKDIAARRVKDARGER